MSKLFQNIPLPSAIILGVTLVLATRAVAADAPETGIIQPQTATSLQVASPIRLLAQSPQESTVPSQGVNVFQPSDLNPTNSTAQSPSSLIERYGCMLGYSDGTFRGDRPVSRYEFAATLNACLNQVNQLINANTGDRVTQKDLAAPKRQLETLGSELERLRMRVDRLDTEN